MTPLQSVKQLLEPICIPPHLLMDVSFYKESNEGQLRDLILEQVFDFYNSSLKESPRAVNFIEQHLFTSDLTFVDEFNVGFVDRSLGKKLPDPDSYSGGSFRGELQRLGLMKPSGHEAFRGALVFPLFDIDGRLQGVYGLWIGIGPRYTENNYVLWNQSDFALFNPIAVKLGRVILCENPHEAAMLWSYGFLNAVSVVCPKTTDDIFFALMQLDNIDKVELFHHTLDSMDWVNEAGKALNMLNVNFKVKSLEDYMPAC